MRAAIDARGPATTPARSGAFVDLYAASTTAPAQPVAAAPAPGVDDLPWRPASRPARGGLGSGGATFPHPTAGRVGGGAPEPFLPVSSLSETDRPEAADPDQVDLRATSAVPRRWRLLHRVQQLCRPTDPAERGPAVCGCGRPGYDATAVNIHLRAGRDGRARAGVSGVYRCGSPWLCPTCAPAAAADRAERVQAVADATLARGGAVTLVVLTASHGPDDSLADLKALVGGASRRARAGRAWGRLQEAHGLLGVVVGQEVTVSRRAGWHYHQHLAVPVDGPTPTETAAAVNDPNRLAAFVRDRALAAGEAVAERYKAALRAAGGTVSDQHGCYVRVADDADDASGYTAKGSAAWEISGGHKTATRVAASLTPFDLADAAYDGDAWALARWVEYVETMPGTRSCVVTRSLADVLGLATEAEDEQPGEQQYHEAEDVVGRLSVETWRELMRAAAVPALLVRVELGGAEAWLETAAWAETVAAAGIARREARRMREVEAVADRRAREAAATRAYALRRAADRVRSSGAGPLGARDAVRRAVAEAAAVHGAVLDPVEIIQTLAEAACRAA
ncbi:hypothetical protein [Methylopila sp. M107]|uniref:hypothetical protein n=1 Tax=Methylopila sp. M107 TaxID=1101190 RepID=UPI000399BED9|nr:hypothetical protein [Methylopila sp. M107]